MYPVVPYNARMAVQDTVLPLGGGPNGKSPVFIKKGQLVAYHVYAMHRRKDFYGTDAEQFNPDRWETLRPSWEVNSYRIERLLRKFPVLTPSV